MQTGLYKHYKGNLYEVVGVVCHSETSEKLILYRAPYYCPDLEEDFGKHPFFVRPYGMFFEEIEYEGKKIKRFEFLRESL